MQRAHMCIWSLPDTVNPLPQSEHLLWSSMSSNSNTVVSLHVSLVIQGICCHRRSTHSPARHVHCPRIGCLSSRALLVHIPFHKLSTYDPGCLHALFSRVFSFSGRESFWSQMEHLPREEKRWWRQAETYQSTL